MRAVSLPRFRQGLQYTLAAALAVAGLGVLVIATALALTGVAATLGTVVLTGDPFRW